jgi:DNA polymerase III sliding clamp (beta) subunit (PCNA family)
LITISRSLLRQMRSVFRRAGIGKATSGLGSHVLVQTGSDGLRLRGLNHDTAVEFHQPGRHTVEQYIVPAQLLEDCEGRKDEPVNLEESGPDHVTAQFTDGGVPQLISYQIEQKIDLDGFPGVPEKVESNEPRLLTALREALDATDRESTRYALGCIQIRGSQGRLVATDGRQVYRAGEFSFPWTDDLLIRGSNVLKSGEFPLDQPVGIGQAGEWVMFVVGYWTVWLRIERDGRFPSVESIIPNSATAIARLELDPADAEFLGRSLARLPGGADPYEPVTIDLNGQAAIRAKDDNAAHPVELVLSRSHSSGEPLALTTNRRFLDRAVALGFRELCFYGRDRPILCDDGRRHYLWSVLDPKDVIRPDDQAVRVDSTAADQNGHVVGPKTTIKPRRAHRPMETTNGNGSQQEPRPRRRRQNPGNSATTSSANGQSDGASSLELADLAYASLHDALIKTRALIVALRREKKQRRLVESTLASLKQLQKVAD